jgi:hypothetical protein
VEELGPATTHPVGGHGHGFDVAGGVDGGDEGLGAAGTQPQEVRLVDQAEETSVMLDEEQVLHAALGHHHPCAMGRCIRGECEGCPDHMHGNRVVEPALLEADHMQHVAQANEAQRKPACRVADDRGVEMILTKPIQDLAHAGAGRHDERFASREVAQEGLVGSPGAREIRCLGHPSIELAHWVPPAISRSSLTFSTKSRVENGLDI